MHLVGLIYLNVWWYTDLQTLKIRIGIPNVTARNCIAESARSISLSLGALHVTFVREWVTPCWLWHSWSSSCVFCANYALFLKEQLLDAFSGLKRGEYFFSALAFESWKMKGKPPRKARIRSIGSFCLSVCLPACLPACLPFCRHEKTRLLLEGFSLNYALGVTKIQFGLKSNKSLYMMTYIYDYFLDESYNGCPFFLPRLPMLL